MVGVGWDDGGGMAHRVQKKIKMLRDLYDISRKRNRERSGGREKGEEVEIKKELYTERNRFLEMTSQEYVYIHISIDMVWLKKIMLHTNQ